MSEPDSKPTGLPGARQDVPFHERRKTARFLVRDVRGTMSWQGEAGAASCDIDVLNISGGGAAVRAENAPQAGQTLALQLHCESAKMEPVEAVALSSSPDSTGKLVIRLRFAHWVPLDAILEKHRERRLWARYPARESRATLTWLEGTTEKATHGNLLNISGGGVAFIADVLPPPGVPIWLQFDAGVRQVDCFEPVESRLVTTSVDPTGAKIAHIQFVTPCPMDLFEVVVSGSE